MDWRQSLMERDQRCVGALVIDELFNIVEVSDGAIAAGGYVPAALVGRSAVDLVHPDDLTRAVQVLDELKTMPGERPDGMYRLRMSDGSYQQMAVRAHNYGPAENNTILFEFREPTEQMRAEAFADDAVDVMRMLSENLGLEDSFDWVMRVAERHVIGLQLVITIFESDGPNQVFSRQPISAHLARANQEADAQTLPVHVEAAVNELSAGPWRSSRKIASLDHVHPGRLTSILVDLDGDIVGYVEALRQTSEPPEDSEWLVHGMISRMMTATLHRFQVDERLRYAADRDALTGLINRRRLLEKMTDGVELVDSSLIVIDLDNFSWINNTLGHQAGDDALVAVARGLEHACPDEAVIARLGGDEFVVWSTSFYDTTGLQQLALAIRESMMLAPQSTDQRRLVRCSLGAVSARADESPAELISRADSAMYVSKRYGGDSATVA